MIKNILFFVVVTCIFVFLGCDSDPASITSSSSPTLPVQEKKASSLLLLQVELRQQQIAKPTAERLEQMEAMGMSLEPINIQRIFMYFIEKPNEDQLGELQQLGLTVYPDSWVPPSGAHPNGFMLADVPIGALADLTNKEYVVSLDTAEQQFELQDGIGMTVEESPQELSAFEE